MSTDALSPKSLSDLADYSGSPFSPGNPYFAEAEPYMANQWKNVVFPFLEGCDFTASLDLAAGHGRNSELLLKHCKTLTVMDYQAGNLDVCRRRLGDRADVAYLKCNGFDLQPQPDDSITLVYCFDAMVHFDSDVVRSYLRDFLRVLKPGGRAFLHHSNYTGGHDWKTNPMSRNFMSRELFAHYALKEGLKLVRQKTIPWGGMADLDCLSLVERPARAS